MRIGLMADTHDNLPELDKAIERLRSEDVDLVLHAGDYIAPFVIPRLSELDVRFIGVFGNNDGDREFLMRRAAEFDGIELIGNFARIATDEMQIALLHGHEVELLTALIESEAFDCVVHGHSHRAEHYRSGNTLVVNPGEVCGYITGVSSVAVLDTVTGSAEIIRI